MPRDGGQRPGGIDEVEVLVVGAGMRNFVFVKIVTSDGIVGWGEATLEWKTRAVVGALEDVRPLLLGKDPFHTERLWQSMHRHQFWKGGVVAMTALSGVDQALHDVKARALGVPLYELLGGSVRDRLRLYDHLGGGDPEEIYAEPDPQRFAAAAVRSVEQGFTAVKILPLPAVEPLPSGRAVREAVRVVEAVREAVGDEVEIILDLHGRTTAAGAIALGRAVAPLRPWFLEEPVQPEDVGALRRVADAVPVPLATGERLAGLAAFLPVLDTRAVAVLQPDVCHCGGPSEIRRIAAVAAVYGVALAPHNSLGPIATAHSLHVAASTPSWLIQEQMRNAVPHFDELVSAPLRVAGGFAPLPEGPGLGVSVDEDVAARHPYEPERQVAATLADGTVADW
jgi:galactonate dehydratase